jgi:type II secretory pathway pseudopilin PulG
MVPIPVPWLDEESPLVVPVRRGFSLVQLLMVVALMGAILFQLIPTIRDLKVRSALRAARMELVAAFSAAQEAALQKGKVATLTISGNTLSVTALSGLTGNSVPVLGPLRFDADFGATITPLTPAPATLTFDARGLITPATTTTSSYVLTVQNRADTVCVTGGGLVLPKGCVL